MVEAGFSTNDGGYTRRVGDVIQMISPTWDKTDAATRDWPTPAMVHWVACAIRVPKTASSIAPTAIVVPAHNRVDTPLACLMLAEVREWKHHA